MRVLLAATSAIALMAGAVSAASNTRVRGFETSPILHRSKAAKMLYNQNSSPTGFAIVSQNFSKTDSQYECAAADDFVVPSGYIWKIDEVDVTGIYYQASIAATNADVIFYKDKNGKPGKIIKARLDQKINNLGQWGSFSVKFDSTVKLKPGTFWLSFAPNSSFANSFDWGWEINSTIHGNQAMWENPGGGFGVCPTWGTIGGCLGYTGDLMFDLMGRG